MNDELKEKVETAITRLQSFAPKDGEYYLAFSGGKDSVVIKALADMAQVKYHAVYRVTSVDPPKLVQFIKQVHPDVQRELPRDKNGNVLTMWSLIVKKMTPPTRILRYCCEHLKESAGDGEMTITGVRWAESTNRANNHGMVTIMTSERLVRESPDFRENKRGGVILVNDNEDSRRMVEFCYKRQRTALNPIIDWTDKDVWDFIHELKIPYCSLYDEGLARLGCIGCPMARKKGREREFMRWPTYKRAYLRAFDKMLKVRQEKGKPFKPLGVDATAEDVFNWWMEYDVLPGQIDLLAEQPTE